MEDDNDIFSVESLTNFFRHGVESYKRLGAVAFPNLAHRLINGVSISSAIRGWLQGFKNRGGPDDARIIQNIQSAAETVLREKAEALLTLIAEKASDAGQESASEQLFCAMQIANACELESAPQILQGAVNQNFLDRWKPGENFGALLTELLFAQNNAAGTGNIPPPSPQ